MPQRVVNGTCVMVLVCPKCKHALEFSKEQPHFCAYCGQALGQVQLETTGSFHSEAPTLGPSEAGSRTGGTPVPPAPVLLAETLQAIGGYRLVRLIGGGGMGQVYEALDSTTGRRVALKLISPEFATSRESVERFRQEGRLASAIAHPRCVFVLAADEEAGRPYIVMELMSGSTLSDLVKTAGPLRPDQAVAKILDVMEGLQEAHRLGVIHRDVKPSNCFLEANGRVKIGDFGLSKSLVADSHLTKTGTFMGTPLFSAPEQVRMEKVDQSADIYSVAATLYFLLTGQAPFQTGDAMATMARIVSDDPPSLRTLRPDIPRALDKIVLRGLDRDRNRRWRNWEEFRLALLPFLPGHLSIGSLGWRLVAYLLDAVILWMASFVLSGLAVTFRTGSVTTFLNPPGAAKYSEDPVLQSLGYVSLSFGILYFGLLEGIWGWSLGKRLLGLRVYGVGSNHAPGAKKGLLRAVVFYLLMDLQLLVVWIGPVFGLPKPDSRQWQEQNFENPWQIFSQAMLYTLPVLVAAITGKVLVICTMRARNGYRGLHEFASGTRVIRLPEAETRRPLWSRLPAVIAGAGVTRVPPGMPDRIGSFRVLGALVSNPKDQILVGEDPGLLRKVWIWLRPVTQPALPAARLEVGRPGRLRWLACGKREGEAPAEPPFTPDGSAAASPSRRQTDEMHWDAFLAPTGCSLTNLIRAEGKLSWPEARTILAELTAELTSASLDQTLPPLLTVAQVWLQANERVLLLDMPLGDSANATREGVESEDKKSNDQERPLSLLRQVAVLTLEGKPRTNDSRGIPIQAPLPGSAARLLRRLFDGTGKTPLPPYQKVEDLHADFEATRSQPTEITRGWRSWHLTILAAFLSVGFCFCMWPISVFTSANQSMVLQMEFATELNQSALRDLEEGSAGEFMASAVSPDPWFRLRGAAQWGTDLTLKQQLEESLKALRREHENRKGELNALLRWARSWQEESQRQNPQLKAQVEMRRASLPRRHFRTEAADAINNASLAQLRKSGETVYLMILPMLAVWPSVWVLWAFVTRGGISYRLAGIALVRANGRPALRLQCLWRALLVWAPFTGLFLLSGWLDAWYWSVWPSPALREEYRWLAHLSVACWWGSLLLLGLYVVLAIRSPNRSLHDRLAGTYLVPR